ncbi:MAG: sigma-70 family RNA polymerase sigma factor [Spirochaetes bacterium]|nr:sigma-70 family RNA polymerase sigma factor [Spirochaetota bacterium]
METTMTAVRSAGERRMKNSVGDFFARNRARLLHFIRKKAAGLTEYDPDDILQDVMLSLVGRDDALDTVENLAGYVTRSISNRIIDRRRSKKPAVSMEERADEESLSIGETLGQTDYEAHTRMEKKELARRIREAVDALPPPYQSVWVATEIEGRSFNELSEAWKEPVNTLLSRKHRAAKMLRKALHDIEPAT